MPPSSRLLVGVAGIPASGKSTMARLIVDETNKLLDELSVCVDLDGWHLTRAELDAFPDPKLAYDRRGSHWTFDSAAYLSFIQSIRQPVTTETTTIWAPSFDHALKDPIPNAVAVEPRHRIVVIEGLYTFLSLEPWIQAGKMLDERWWIDVARDEARRRLVRRHLASGVTRDHHEALWRIEHNDDPNGDYIAKNSLEPTRIVHSITEPDQPGLAFQC